MFALGRSLLAGPLTGAIVNAAGAITCSAVAKGKARRDVYARKNTASACVAKGTGKVIKTVKVKAVPVKVAATVKAKAKTDLRLKGIAKAIVSIKGRAKASFVLKAQATAQARVTGKLYRTVRVNGRTEGVANLHGEAQLWSLAYGLQIIARANVFATTDYVGYGHIEASAEASSGEAARTGVAKGSARSSATLTTRMSSKLYGKGAAAGKAILATDPAVYVSSTKTKTVDASGAVTAKATPAERGAYIHTVSLAVGRSYPKAAATRTHVAKGKATGKAVGTGASQIVIPATATAVLTAVASGGATAHIDAHGVAQVKPDLELHGSATVYYFAKAKVAGKAEVSRGAVQYGVITSVEGTASATGRVLRTATVTGEALGEALPTGNLRLSASAAGRAACTAFGVGKLVFWPKILISGSTLAEAIVTGAMNVNMFTYAPVSRTLVITPFTRLVLISSESRLIATVGSTRRTAA